MTGTPSSHGAQLEGLLSEAFELDEEARERFLDTLDPALRRDLARLLKADAVPSPVDRNCTGLVEAAAAVAGGMDSSSTIVVGLQIGSYRLLRLLGEGGSASVWLAERVDGSFNHQVAVKCLKTGLATPASRARFLREQQIMAQLQHPYIERLYDAGVSSDNVPYIVMEWVDGVSLTRHCDERRMGLTQRLHLFRKVCSAVAHAHQSLIVHRDLKPANILVGRDGEPKLLDFGIAKLLDESAPVTRTGMHMLTPEYAAPEQFSDGMITTATDGYALGVVLYELLCGLRPQAFSRNRAPTEMAVTMPSEAFLRLSRAPADTQHPLQLAEQRAISVEHLPRTLRGDLDTIVLKALQPEPHRRYATVQALSDDIERYLQQQPISARKDAGLYRTGKFLRRHALAVVLSALAIVALLTATTVSVYQARRAQSATLRAENQTRRAQTEATRALATKEFLINLFEVSDAGMPRDQVPTTQTLLQDGAKRIRGEFGDAPDVKFDLLLLLGRVQLHLGQYDSAEPLLKEALSIADARFAGDSIQRLQAHTLWANVLHEQTHFAQAAQELSMAIATHRHAGAGDSDALTEALAVLGKIESNLDQFDQAVATSRQARDMAQHLHGPHHPEVQKALENLGRVLLRAGHLDEAEKVCRADVVLSGELYGQHDAKYANSLTLLADVLSQQDKNPESERLARQALGIEESVYDRPNAALIDTLSALNDSLYNQDKLDENESVLQRWLAAQTQLTAPGDPSTAPILVNLGLMANRRHEYAQSERIFRQALAIYDKHPGADPPSLIADTWRALADELIAQQRWPEAADAVQQATTIDRGESGNDGGRVGLDLLELSFVNMKMTHLQPALVQADDALRILVKISPADEADANDARVQKAAVLNRLSRSDEAKTLLTAMIPRLRQAGAEFENRERLSRSLTELGRAQAGTGDTHAALASWDEALALQLAMKVPDTQEIGELQGLIAPARKERRNTQR